MTSAARPYAEALYAAAEREGAVEATVAGLEAVQQALRDEPRAALLFRHPEVGHQAAQEALAGVAGRCPPLAGRFLQLLFARRRMPLLDDVVARYRERMDAEGGIVRGRLESARAVAPELEGRVVEALGRRTGKQVVLTAAEKPDLIGGLRVVMGDRILDVTVAGRLEALRRQLQASPAE